jgi:hypothetical protein
MNVSEIIALLQSRGCNPIKNCNGWKSLCPAHEDKNPSLSITEGTDGKILLHCQAACHLEAITEALGIKTKDLFPRCEPKQPAKIVKTYDYTDLHRLVQKLNLCAGLQDSLRQANWVQRLRVCQLEFRKQLQLWKANAGEFKDVEELFRRAGSLDASASVQQLSALVGKVGQQAIELLKSFAESLSPRK